MLRFTWMCIVLCLLAGVLFLGVDIFSKSSKIQDELALQKARFGEKLSKLKADTAKMGEEIRKARDTIATVSDKGDSVTEKESKAANDKKVGTSAASPGDKQGNNTVEAIDPIDEEDRLLTSDVMEHDGPERQDIPQQGEEESRFAQKNVATVTAPKEDSMEKPPQPLDLKRLSRIKDLYLKTCELLEFN